MEKINYYKQERDLADRLVHFLEAERRPRRERRTGRVTEPATNEQLELLAKFGIYPKWLATRQEANEMICNYRIILNSVNRVP